MLPPFLGVSFPRDPAPGLFYFPKALEGIPGWLQLTHQGLEADSPRGGLEEGQGPHSENHVTSIAQWEGATGTCEEWVESVGGVTAESGSAVTGNF